MKRKSGTRFNLKCLLQCSSYLKVHSRPGNHHQGCNWISCPWISPLSCSSVFQKKLWMGFWYSCFTNHRLEIHCFRKVKGASINSEFMNHSSRKHSENTSNWDLTSRVVNMNGLNTTVLLGLKLSENCFLKFDPGCRTRKSSLMKVFLWNPGTENCFLEIFSSEIV